MAITRKGGNVDITTEFCRLTRKEIEFLFNLIEQGMIPGKYLALACSAVNKLKNQHDIADKTPAEIRDKVKEWKGNSVEN
jgi:predicted transcriptional regulator|tara:strand:+ start:89 stop:328 length:240 start_codon:yes stop_codon:yes gene_type:complete